MMKQLSTILVAVALTSPPTIAHAWLINKGGGSSAYVGPGDVGGANAKLWCGVRAYSNAKAVALANALQLRRASDSTTQDIKVKLNGDLDVANAASFCSGTSCTVTKCYDQSPGGLNGGGVADFSAPGGSNEPAFVFGCNGTRPCIRFTTAGTTCLSTPSPLTTIASPQTYNSIVRLTTDNTGGVLIQGNSGSNPWTQITAANFIRGRAVIGTGISVAVTDGVWQFWSTVFDGASGLIRLNGNETTGDTGSSSTSTANYTIGAAATCSSNATFDFVEGGVWAGAMSAGDRGTLEANEMAYYPDAARFGHPTGGPVWPLGNQ